MSKEEELYNKYLIKIYLILPQRLKALTAQKNSHCNIIS
jgi:hypothetical protein